MCRATPLPEAVSLNLSTWHSTVALARGHFCSLLLLLERGWRDRIKVWRTQQRRRRPDEHYFSRCFPTLPLKEEGKIPSKAAVSGKRRGHWEQVQEGCLVLVKKGQESLKFDKMQSYLWNHFRPCQSGLYLQFYL